jgi:hypothetical protein
MITRYRRWFIARAARTELAEAIRRCRHWPDEHDRLTTEVTVEPIIEDRRHLRRYRWEVVAIIGRRRDPARFECAAPWHPAPLTFTGVAVDGTAASIDARAVQAILTRQHAELVGAPHPVRLS